MGETAETVIRRFIATWPRSDIDEMVGFFSDDAVHTDGPRGSFRGIDAIRAEFQSLVQIAPSTTSDVKNLVASGGTVIVERVDAFEIYGKPFDLEVVGVFEVDGDGRITRWRDYFDLRSLEERVAATMGAVD